jgi:hypothetical protein
MRFDGGWCVEQCERVAKRERVVSHISKPAAQQRLRPASATAAQKTHLCSALDLSDSSSMRPRVESAACASAAVTAPPSSDGSWPYLMNGWIFLFGWLVGWDWIWLVGIDMHEGRRTSAPRPPAVGGRESSRNPRGSPECRPVLRGRGNRNWLDMQIKISLQVWTTTDPTHHQLE